MPYITEHDIWRQKIWRLELDTPAQGGEPAFEADGQGNVTPSGGYDNIQAKLLADRTLNLQNRLLTIENQLLHTRLTAVENNSVGTLVFKTYYPSNMFSLQDYAFDGVLWLAGQEISRTTYDKLFAKVEPHIGSGAWGEGDGSATFTLPDLRGEFLRAWDGGRGIDANREFGSWQDYATARPKTTDPEGVSHDGFLQGLSGAHNPSQVAFIRVANPGESITRKDADSDWGSGGAELDTENPVAGDPETRSRNYAFLYCVKY